MSKSPIRRGIAIALAATALSFMVTPVAAKTSVLTPAGTKVGLAFLDPVDTAKAKSGSTVHFQVATDVVVDKHIVIKKGTTLAGTIKTVGHPFPQNAGFADISLLAVSTVDRKMVNLNDVRVSAPLLGGDIRVPAGTVVTTSTKADVMIDLP